MTLTQQQLAEFNKNGFLVLHNFLEKEVCQAILARTLTHLEHKIEPIESESDYSGKSEKYRTHVIDYSSIEDKQSLTVRRLRQVYDRDILFKNWMENEKIRPILKQVLEDEVVLTTAHHNSIMTKAPMQSTATSWHQDRRYWSYSDNNLVSVWLALGEENSENGALEFIPASHKMSFSKEQFGEKEYFREDNEKNISLIKTKKRTNLKAGDVVLFHCKLLHRANKNSTQKAKISFVYTVKGQKTKALHASRSAQYKEIFLP
ncbi:MAG: Phytanoyl-CoA dioxygenase [uncultured Sulfurovum sp.]|uniref:Phytanoyl-CoA dioxygenase n=1 Tax=uncultured Sulfurovum sp. TaxID=269237 RepID=A0A6S6TW50_9BACT|nr:MAG: Phytanoyl-CoA dioxygenase [uncultured Sulfurovum sp.]